MKAIIDSLQSARIALTENLKSIQSSIDEQAKERKELRENYNQEQREKYIADRNNSFCDTYLLDEKSGATTNALVKVTQAIDLLNEISSVEDVCFFPEPLEPAESINAIDELSKLYTVIGVVDTIARRLVHCRLFANGDEEAYKKISRDFQSVLGADIYYAVEQMAADIIAESED